MGPQSLWTHYKKSQSLDSSRVRHLLLRKNNQELIPVVLVSDLGSVCGCVSIYQSKKKKGLIKKMGWDLVCNSQTLFYYFFYCQAISFFIQTFLDANITFISFTTMDTSMAWSISECLNASLYSIWNAILCSSKAPESCMVVRTKY